MDMKTPKLYKMAEKFMVRKSVRERKDRFEV